MRIVSGATSAVRHALGAGAEGLIAAGIAASLIVVLAPVYSGADLLAGNAAAGAGANTITVVDSGARVVVGYGDTVTTRATLARDYYLVYTRVVCSTDGRDVYEAWKNIKTGTWTSDGYASFTLTSDTWGSGGASCRADLLNAVMRGGHRVYKTLATTDFSVGG